MPTKRAWIFLIVAAALYFLANQTQVGWLYVITAGIVGLLLVAFFCGRGMLKPIKISRTFHRPPPTEPITPTSPANGRPPTLTESDNLEFTLPTFYEDNPLEITLQVNHASWRPALLVHGSETCPCAPQRTNLSPFLFPACSKDSRSN